jgi:signal transduction histidine kinase
MRYHEGERRYENVTVFPLIANGVQGAVIRVDDITDRVQIEEMMVQSEKMMSVGGLAAGMAHEINNPLAGMMQTATVMCDRLSNLELAANRAAAAEAGVPLQGIKAFMEARGIFKMLNRITESGMRAADIVSNMLSFARRDSGTISSHRLCELMDQTLDLAGTDYDLKKRYDFRQIDILRKYAKDVPKVPCQPAKLQQVLMNIFRNGAEAMQSAKAAHPHADGWVPQFILRLAHERAAGWVRIEIEDNGPGMEESVRRRVFEPFFTTKPTDRGTGLGLSVSYFIITENHRGEMSVQSSPGQGSTFIIRLPVSREGGPEQQADN